jgi:hypothetical protein
MSLGGSPEFERMQLHEKRFFTGVTVTLCHKNGVILQVDVWYLILSAMLRGDIPKSVREILDDCMLTAKINIGGEDYVFECLQPQEFQGDGREVTKSVTDSDKKCHPDSHGTDGL